MCDVCGVCVCVCVCVCGVCVRVFPKTKLWPVVLLGL